MLEYGEYGDRKMAALAPKVVEMYWSGSTVKQIAKDLNVSENLVLKTLRIAGGKVSKRGGYNIVQPAKIGVEKIDKIMELSAQGFTVKEIAEAVSVDARTVKRHAPETIGRRKVVEKVSKPAVNEVVLEPELLAKIGLMVEDEVPLAEICRTFHVTTHAVKKYFPNAGVRNGTEVRALLRRAEEVYESYGV